VDVEITPEPSDAERQAILALIDGVGFRPRAYASRWRESGLDDLRGDASAEDAGRDPGVVEP
jgi:hypothetical protein